MKNFKTIALGVCLALLTVGFSAFTNVNKAPGDHFVTLDGINYTYVSSADFDAESCLNQSQVACYYLLTSAGSSNIPRTGSFNSTQAPGYLSGATTPGNLPWITQPETRTGIYNP